jgi:hypothetical protein
MPSPARHSTPLRIRTKRRSIRKRSCGRRERITSPPAIAAAHANACRACRRRDQGCPLWRRLRRGTAGIVASPTTLRQQRSGMILSALKPRKLKPLHPACHQDSPIARGGIKGCSSAPGQPSIQPSFASAPRNAGTRDCAAGSLSEKAISMPINRIRSDRCACATSGSRRGDTGDKCDELSPLNDGRQRERES